jgi:hypothetical protein
LSLNPEESNGSCMSQKEKVEADFKQAGKETGPLSWEQLSEDERQIINEIERRLDEVKQQAAQLEEDDRKVDEANDEEGSPLAKHEQLYERVFLIDGGRGTGKSSILQTLIQRWTEKAQHGDPGIPTFVKPFYLDFDPLPHKMPLMAGIVQAWKRLAKYYDKSTGKLEECDDENPTLEDQWHTLFHVAAVGWSDTPHEHGLVEQVLNREDQVQNWYHLKEEWECFIDKLIKAGRCAKDPKYKITDTPVFVIAIDDVDLQVERMRELLPALRNLYHPNVVFIVAADKAHMVDMLQLSFSGQQRRLANLQPHDKSDSPDQSIWLDRKESWPEILAQESIRKVFPPRNTWKLQKRSLREMLDFPPNAEKNDEKTLRSYFESWRQQDTTKSGNFGNLAVYFDEMAGKAEDPVQLPLIISYRAVDQIFKRISHIATGNKKGALTAIRGILAQSDEDLVRLGRVPDQSDEQLALALETPKKIEALDTTPTNAEPTNDDIHLAANVIYQGIGNLQAIFPEVFEYDTGKDSRMVLSGYPHFRYEVGASKKPVRMESPEFITALIAGSLRDDGYGILAPGLRWNIQTAIAWTSARIMQLGLYLTLRWQLHIHPSPLRLYQWANEWSLFIETLSTETKELDSRIAYAWIYYQLKWLGTNPAQDAPQLPTPPKANLLTEQHWKELLRLEPKHGTSTEISQWKTRTLPLMARPELWLLPELQKNLLNPVGVEIETEWLRDQRERLITDGIVASGNLGFPTPENPEDQELARQAATYFNKRHREIIQEKPAWEVYVGLPSSTAKMQKKTVSKKK